MKTRNFVALTIACVSASAAGFLITAQSADESAPQKIEGPVGINASTKPVEKAAAKIEATTANPVAWTTVAQHQCANGSLFWFQRRRLSDGSLCTTYSFQQWSSPGLGWNSSWNCQASKYYCAGSTTHSCFQQETDNC